MLKGTDFVILSNDEFSDVLNLLKEVRDNYFITHNLNSDTCMKDEFYWRICFTIGIIDK
jgi:hypothetical protein